ncbi:MAG: ABC transporter permease [Bacteroidota bacterium]|nr:ABC transporter permease [Bacteroidota bacterium]
MSDNITVIEPQKGWQIVDWKELIRYKDLFYFLVLRGLKAKYAQSVLGIGWAIIQPLFSVLVFTVIFGNLAKIDSDGVPYSVFSLCGLVPWAYFSGTLIDSSSSLISNANMISKVYFPRLVLPISSAFSKLVDMAISFCILIGFMIYFQISPTIYALMIPYFILIMMLTAVGLGLILSSMAVQYRDVKHALSFAVQILMYAAPVIYPASKIPAQFQFIYSLNPMVGVIEGFRSALLGTNPMPWDYIITGSIVAAILAVVGAFYFKRMERTFADVA